MSKRITAKAVLLDVYGTVITSTASSRDRQNQSVPKKMEPYLAKTVKKFGLGKALGGKSRAKPERTLYLLMQEEISKDHAKSKSRGIKFPEVKIEKIWARVLKRLGVSGQLEKKGKAVVNFYNALHKKTKLYPGCKSALLNLHKRGIVVGIVSNAQFYTTPQLKKLFGKKDFERIFTGPIVMSFKIECSKPNPKPFQLAVSKLNSKGIEAHETVYIGNDRYKDVWGARNAAKSIKTILFAADCVKWRRKELKGKSARPDAVIRAWKNIPRVVL